MKTFKVLTLNTRRAIITTRKPLSEGVSRADSDYRNPASIVTGLGTRSLLATGKGPEVVDSMDTLRLREGQELPIVMIHSVRRPATDTDPVPFPLTIRVLAPNRNVPQILPGV